MLEVHAILQRQRCNENITKKTGTLSDAYKSLSSKIKSFRIEKKNKEMTYDPINDKVI